MRGLEPPRPFGHTDLNRARLPVPPHPLGPQEHSAHAVSSGSGSRPARREPDKARAVRVVPMAPQVQQVLPARMLRHDIGPDESDFRESDRRALLALDAWHALRSGDRSGGRAAHHVPRPAAHLRDARGARRGRRETRCARGTGTPRASYHDDLPALRPTAGRFGASRAGIRQVGPYSGASRRPDAALAAAVASSSSRPPIHTSAKRSPITPPPTIPIAIPAGSQYL
jgi:hypothetical protein